MNTNFDSTTNPALVDSAVSPTLPREHLIPISDNRMGQARSILHAAFVARLPELNESLRKIAYSR